MADEALMMYFAQGIPRGLLSIAIPAWLASQGVGAAEIGSYLAVIVLPWAFKLVTGPVMDRYEFLAMGRRRPWALAAQLGLSLSLLALMLVEEPAEQIGLLMLIGVIVNSFAATQDVAVDGMSIANLGSAAGSKVYGMFADGSNYVESIMLISVFVAMIVFVAFFHRD